MPKINVYLPDDLAEQVRALELPVSAICQGALEHAVRSSTARRRRRRPRGMFTRFNTSARETLLRAQEESRLLSHNYIGTEHVLLGILTGGDRATTVLSEAGLTAAVARAEVLDIIGPGASAPVGHIPFTPRTKKILELALREAVALGHNDIGNEHLLLATVREGDGVAAQIIGRKGLTYRDLKEKLLATPRQKDEEADGLGATDEPAGKGEVELVPLIEARIDRLKDEVAEQLRALHAQVDQEKERNQQLWEMLGAKPGATKATPAPGPARMPDDLLKCSFCGRLQRSVGKLVAGPGVTICSDCIDLCHEIVDDGEPDSTEPPD